MYTHVPVRGLGNRGEVVGKEGLGPCGWGAGGRALVEGLVRRAERDVRANASAHARIHSRRLGGAIYGS